MEKRERKEKIAFFSFVFGASVYFVLLPECIHFACDKYYFR